MTAADGYTAWNAIPVGSYRVTETLPAGWRAILPAAAAAGVNFNATTDVTFGNQRLGNLRVFKYEDIDGDGQRDAGEGPVQGIAVTARFPSGVTETKLTAADGYTVWNAIPVGSYRVTETLPAGWRAILPPAAAAGVNFNTTTDVTFGNQRLGNLRVFKYEDIDGDGQQDAGEGPVQGIAVTARFPSGVTETKLTAADGYTVWNAIPVGSYRVTETLPAGWRAILPPAVAAGVNFNATTDVTFGNQRLGNLRVFKYEDIDGDGQRDAGEGPVQGIAVTARFPSGVTETKLTAADGYTVWNAIPVGSYRVTETLPAGWRAILPAAAAAAVNFNTTTDVTFGNQRLGNLRVFKYEDIDGDGQQDAGEGPVQGIAVTARFPSGVTETKLTAADGYTVWNAIPVGSYRVTETLPAGWRAILPPAVAAGVNFNATTDVTFGNQRLGNLRVFKYEDIDGDGQQDAGEGPVQGIAVTARFPSGVTETKLTAADGYTVWNAIPVGSYRVTETLPAGWRAILPAAAAAAVNFNTTTDVTFANQRLGNLRVFKYEDIDGDGQQDAGEGPVQGIAVTARFPSGATETKLTAADGYTAWNAIPVGSYRVTETLPAGWRAILPPAVAAGVNFNTTTDVTFANQRRGNLHSFVFEDVNGNGQRDAGRESCAGHPGQPALPGWVYRCSTHRRHRRYLLEHDSRGTLPGSRDRAWRLARHPAHLRVGRGHL